MYKDKDTDTEQCELSVKCKMKHYIVYKLHVLMTIKIVSPAEVTPLFMVSVLVPWLCGKI